MAFSYEPLWQLLKKKNIKKSHLIRRAGMSSYTFHQIRCGKNITMTVLDRICDTLDCRIEDIIEYRKEVVQNTGCEEAGGHEL